jgi:hypothetical protein
MILMAGQGSATRKGLLAIGIWALVRSLSRVDTTMARQGTRVTEGLWVSGLGLVIKHKMLGNGGRMYLSATLTHMGLLARVNTLMHGQSRALNKLFATVRILAYVRADTTVDTLCQIVSGGNVSSVEGLSALP